MTYSEIMYKHLLKTFYERTNKKEYKSQILEDNICYINVIAIQDAILRIKVLLRNIKKKELIVNTPDIEVK